MAATTSGLHLLNSSPRSALSRLSSRTSKLPTLLAFAEHVATSKALRGVGSSNLYDLGTGQRAGPTVRKKTDSNRVLTRKPSITGLTAWKEARFNG
ncbi:hypothetical protein [Winkia neuii]|uniref:hypothetical protein n=1 Tax=Winkia neuii TaxID=33007 RepID=UPI00114CAD0C|nr:hypothetical protein [Winkia neuii]MDK8098841.1 hypothetical protein [Winkia neuii]